MPSTTYFEGRLREPSHALWVSGAMLLDAFPNHRIECVIFLDPSFADFVRHVGQSLQALSLRRILLLLWHVRFPVLEPGTGCELSRIGALLLISALVGQHTSGSRRVELK